MNTFIAVLAFVAVVAAQDRNWVWNAAAHIPSGSVTVDATGAVLAGPSGSVRTDNGLAGLGAGAKLSGPAGDVVTRAGAAILSGPGARVASWTPVTTAWAAPAVAWSPVAPWGWGVRPW